MAKEQKMFTREQARRIEDDANRLNQQVFVQCEEWKAYLKELVDPRLLSIMEMIDQIKPMLTNIGRFDSSGQQSEKGAPSISVVYDMPDALVAHVEALGKDHAFYKALLDGGVMLDEKPIVEPVKK